MVSGPLGPFWSVQAIEARPILLEAWRARFVRLDTSFRPGQIKGLERQIVWPPARRQASAINIFLPRF